MLLRSLTRTEAFGVSAYAALSLAAAFTGSVAALLLVPLVKPGEIHGLGGRMAHLPLSVEKLALYFVAASAALALLRWWAAHLNARLVSGYAVRMRQQVHASLIAAPLPALIDKSSAEIANVLTYNVELIIQGFSSSMQLLVVGVTAAVSLGFALWVSPVLTLILPLALVFAAVASRLFGREQSKISRRFIEDMTRLFWRSEDFTRRLRHVRSFEREDAEKAGYGEISIRLGQALGRQMKLIASGRLLLELLAALGMAAVFVLAHRWRGADSASLIAIGLLLGRLLPYAGSTRQGFKQLRLALPALELWHRYCALGAERVAVPIPDRTNDWLELRIEKLRLSWPLPVRIDDLALRRGELTLLCGDSGIGKSSVVDVLAGMAVPDVFIAHCGEHRLDFEAYRALTKKGAYISQGVRLWQQSLRECLTWAKPEATDQELQQALIDVGFDSRQIETPEALAAALQKAPSRFSGGELQRVLLAQVLLRRPVLALLDESTNALDAASELAVLAALKHRLRETILIVVSHRAGVAALADQRLDLGYGRVARSNRGPRVETREIAETQLSSS
jgi:ABC-type multidrug transport system fused ATPase/permease subunit